MQWNVAQYEIEISGIGFPRKKTYYAFSRGLKHRTLLKFPEQILGYKWLEELWRTISRGGRRMYGLEKLNDRNSAEDDCERQFP